ncbi:alpha/beta fold hydrolase [Escherichia coli]
MSFRAYSSLSILILSILLFSTVSGCRSKAPQVPSGQTTFIDYQQQTAEWVQNHRNFQTAHHDRELEWNTPHEWRPEPTSSRRGILLVHGLGDSPGSFSDIAPVLAKQGFIVRTVLLPGHGTRPSDLLTVSVADWRRIVNEQARILRQDTQEIWVGGFSTGANLALEYAMNNPEVKGAILFSPAIKSQVWFDFLAPIIPLFIDWPEKPSKILSEMTATRYQIIPVNAVTQYYYTSRAIQQKLAKTKYNKSVLLVMAQHDSVVDVNWIMQKFDTYFTNPNSRLIWYGKIDKNQLHSSRLLIKSDYFPQYNISQFSHMSVLFSPENSEYGINGKQRICLNGQTDDDTLKCMKGSKVWFSDWGYTEKDKIHARLTWNPLFKWQSTIIKKITNHN